jgi:hypothetical protein
MSPTKAQMDQLAKDKQMPCACCGKGSAKGESLCRKCADELLGKQVAWELI